MTYLEVLYHVVRTKPEEEPLQDYDFWCVDNDGEILYLKKRNPEEIVSGFKEDVHSFNTSEYIDYIWNMTCPDAEEMLDFNELKKYLDVEVEFEVKPSYDTVMRNPLICVRGTCDKDCTAEHLDCYCLQDLPCTNKRPDWNCWSCKYPNFYDMLHDLFKWVSVCKSLNALVVMFDFTPNEFNKELDFKYATGFKITGNKITIIKDIQKAYEEFNKKYPTEDRRIEESINYNQNDLNFRFNRINDTESMVIK